MKARKKHLLFLLILAFNVAFATFDFTCITLPATYYNYANIPFPADVTNNLADMDNMPATNPTTDSGATLGRVLFYDQDLSLNHTISCASCHIQKFSFTDTARFSKGFNGGLTDRNSMGLIHTRFQRDGQFFWDNRAGTLEIQSLQPFQSPVEMGMRLDTLVARISSKAFYPPLFQNAFGTTAVTTDRIAKAIAQFVRSMNTFGSKFRWGVDHTTGNPSVVPLVNFTAQENLGKDLFMDELRGNCQACHTRNVMVQQGAQNIGLDLVYADNGVGAASGNHTKDGFFSVPSLINVELTAPYMHDGRFNTLEEVIDFYSDSIKPHPNLSGFLREIIPGTVDPNNNQCDTCPPRHLAFTPAEKAALIAFLKTLTDTLITTDPRWSNPFCAGPLTATIASFSPSAGCVGDTVTINGTNIATVTSVKFNSAATASFAIVSNTQLKAVVPVSAITGPITLSNQNNYPVSTVNDFTLTASCTANFILHLKAFIQGYYTGSNTMSRPAGTVTDTITVSLARCGTGHTIAYTATGTIASNGTSDLSFNNVRTGNYYYIVLRHRNSLETWSADSVLFQSVNPTYDFTVSAGKAFGSNQTPVGAGIYAIYSGDIDQDGFVSFSDVLLMNNDIGQFKKGYNRSDLNGDKIVESADFSLLENNISGAVSVRKPL